MILRICAVIALFIAVDAGTLAVAQQQASESSQESNKPRGAFLRSLAVPGWGHFYAGEGNRNRALVHIGTEASGAFSV